MAELTFEAFLQLLEEHGFTVPEDADPSAGLDQYGIDSLDMVRMVAMFAASGSVVPEHLIPGMKSYGDAHYAYEVSRNL